MSPCEIDYIGEGAVDEAIARKLIVASGGVPGLSYRRPFAGTGKQSLDRRIAGLNAGAAFGKPVLVLRDLDHDAACPSELLARLLPARHPRLLLRVCVRESEAWLMADHAAYAKYCGISTGRIPENPEAVADPKQIILGWVERGVASRMTRFMADTRRRQVPDWASLGQWHAEFVEEIWNPERAAGSGRSPSLTRTLYRLRSMVEHH